MDTQSNAVFRLSEEANGPAVSAKFEIDDAGRLILSVYNIPEGLAAAPEAATFTEVSYVAADANSTPAVEVFSDKEHIARSASHMTLFQLSRMTLEQVIVKAVRFKSGVPIDVRNPAVAGRRPVADVVLLDRRSQPFVVTVDLLTGKSSLRK